MRSRVLGLIPSGPRRSLRIARGRWRTRGSRLRRFRAELAGLGQPLEVIGAAGRGLELDGGVRSPAADLAMSLLASRRDGPRLLSTEEWADLRSIGLDSSSQWPDTLRMLHRFAAAREQTWHPSTDGRVVVDVRPLQSAVVNGTVTHARNVIGAVLRSCPDGVELEAFIDPTRPPVDAATLSRFARTFDPATIEEVAAFIEPSPFEEKVLAFDLDVRQGITRVGVWADAIIGTHPERYLTASAQVFGYQYSLECIGVLDHVLVISECSRDEAIALGLDPSRIVITGCRSSFGGVMPCDDPIAFERFILLAATAAPHKDLATAFVGVLPALVRDEEIGVVMLATLTLEQRAEIDRVLDEVGIDRERVTCESQIPTERMVQLFGAATAVVVSSHHEGFSLPNVESIELGTPVVASDIPAHRELLGSGPWMFEPADPFGCARSLRSVLRDPAGSLRRQRTALDARYEPERLDRTITMVLEGVLEPSE